ncbi:MAG: M20/M25/M40 family metallo-hydrolase [Candidatus Eisenbacteria bacterium]|uniref:M20/M25/M40 family metallo-hydrolase n=1 Tax=Eiseniibacteriota bacterium TaxID=2212470 RepID=A0A849SP81_UNCEI|nr:M20/M25/M40 family metallo-hydrolase [Candidatus Eisenbacteria bacterium]
MADSIDPARVRDLTHRLVASSSVSPDAIAENACGAALRAELASFAETGTWGLADGREITWALVRGGSSRTLVCLGHHDTVAVGEYAALDSAGDARLAFDPERLRERLLTLAAGSSESLPDHLRADLEQERSTPGTWMFGRGALDMKSGLAAGVEALRAYATRDGGPAGSVLFVSCPDEEVHSVGMLAAVPRILELRDAQGLAFEGAINLDYAEEPAIHFGVAGKLLLQLWVLGDPTHASEPFRGVDATQLAAAIVSQLTLDPALADLDADSRGVPPVVLRLRDLKDAYDVQTALEAVAEVNLLTRGRSLSEWIRVLKRSVSETLASHARSMRELAARLAPAERARELATPRVLSYAELAERAGPAARETAERAAADAIARGADVRESTLVRVRTLARLAQLSGPAVVLALAPPYYPAAAAREAPIARIAREVAERHDLAVRGVYPHITDASYVAWRDAPAARLAEWLPALGAEYRLPIDAATALDLNVVTLGPWGRDAHGRFERVHAPHAFATLPAALLELFSRTLDRTVPPTELEPPS